MSGVVKDGFLQTFMQQTFNDSEGLELRLHASSSIAAAGTTGGDVDELDASNGYAHIELNLANGGWTVSATGQASYPAQTFTASGGAFLNSSVTADVYGYYITTDGNDVLIASEVDGDAGVPYAVADTESYEIDLSVT